jgi:hypothetical protein
LGAERRPDHERIPPPVTALPPRQAKPKPIPNADEKSACSLQNSC